LFVQPEQGGQRDQYCDQLACFHAQIEIQQRPHQTVFGQSNLLQYRRKTEAVYQPKQKADGPAA